MSRKHAAWLGEVPSSHARSVREYVDAADSAFIAINNYLDADNANAVRALVEMGKLVGAASVHDVSAQGNTSQRDKIVLKDLARMLLDAQEAVIRRLAR